MFLRFFFVCLVFVSRGQRLLLVMLMLGGGAKNKSCAASALAHDVPLWEIGASAFLTIQ